MRLHGTCLYVDDVPAALDFYGRAFGFETRHFDEAMQYGELDTGDTVLAFAAHETGTELTAGEHVRPPDGRPSAVEIAFLTPDVAAAYERALEAGAASVTEPRVMPWGWTMAYVRGPDGVLIGLVSPPEEGDEADRC